MGRGYYDGHNECPGPKASRGWYGRGPIGRTVPLYVRVYTGARMTRPQPSETTQKRAWTRVGTLCVDCGTVSAEDRIASGARVVLAEMATRAGGLPARGE